MRWKRWRAVAAELQSLLGRHIGFRFSLSVLLFSLFVALLAASFSVWNGYRKAVSEIDRQFAEIERSFASSLALSVWNLDGVNLGAQLRGILNLPGISDAAVVDPLGRDILRIGAFDGKGLTVRRTPLRHDAWGQVHEVGELRVAASTEDIRRTLVSEAVSGLLGETLRIVLIAAFVLLAYQRLIGRHLRRISVALKTTEDDGLPREFFLERTVLFSRDELGEIEAAFRAMRDRINVSQQELRQSEQRANAIIDNLGDGLLQVRGDGRIERVNRAAERMFGCTADALQQQHVSALFLDAPGSVSQAAVAAGADPRLAGVEVKCRRAGGTLFPADLVMARMTVGRQESQVWLVRDLSERRASEEQRDFVAMVSHEFRTPLAIISTSIQLLMASLTDPGPKVVQRGDNIRHATQRLIHLLDDYLSIDRLDSAHQGLDLQPGDLLEVIESAINDWPLDRIRLRLHGAPAQLLCDPELMRIVLRNLLANADRHSPADATIELDVNGRADGGVSICIRDHGEGIPADELPRLFQRYFRGRFAQGKPGAGLGLYLVQKIVRAHGGTIEVQSAVGSGTTFTLNLPRAGTTTD